jgi:hypothetical protein
MSLWFAGITPAHFVGAYANQQGGATGKHSPLDELGSSMMIKLSGTAHGIRRIQ